MLGPFRCNRHSKRKPPLRRAGWPRCPRRHLRTSSRSPRLPARTSRSEKPSANETRYRRRPRPTIASFLPPLFLVLLGFLFPFLLVLLVLLFFVALVHLFAPNLT